MRANQRSAETRTTQLGGTLRYGRGLKAFPIVGLIVWLVLFLWIKLAINPSPADSRSGPFVLAVFYFLAIILPWIVFLEAFGTRVVLSWEDIQMHSFWRGTRLIRWEDVESIRQDSWGQAFIVKGHGRRLTLDLTMDGITIFAEAVNQRVPSERWASVSAQLRGLLPKGPYD